jgi:hypothetical protein
LSANFDQHVFHEMVLERLPGLCAPCSEAIKLKTAGVHRFTRQDNPSVTKRCLNSRMERGTEQDCDFVDRVAALSKSRMFRALATVTPPASSRRKRLNGFRSASTRWICSEASFPSMGKVKSLAWPCDPEAVPADLDGLKIMASAVPLEDVWPQTRGQRCCQRAERGAAEPAAKAKRALQRIWLRPPICVATPFGNNARGRLLPRSVLMSTVGTVIGLLLLPRPSSKPQPRTTTVLVDELNSSSLESGSDCLNCFHRNLPPTFFKIHNR